MSVKFHLYCAKVSTVLIFMLFLQSAQAQRVKPGTEIKLEPYQEQIEQKLESAKKELGGFAAFMLYKDGKVVYQKAMGTDFNAKTQAPIGAASQWLTAALIMSFVDQGKLSLEDKVSKYIPIFSKYSKGYITIKDCLAHLAGIESDQGRLAGLSSKKKFATLEEEVDDFASKKEIQSNPGLEFRFSHIGCNIAGRVLEVITKRSFEQLMQERITRPLMMRNTSFSSFNAVNPSGGALSTANDYMNFLTMLLNKGMFNGKQVLSEKAVQALQTVRTTPAMIKYAPKFADGYQYAFGEWAIEADENGVGTVLTSPGLQGTWPMIDRCRGYACIFFTKGDLGEEKKEIYLDIKKFIDDQFPPVNCK